MQVTHSLPPRLAAAQPLAPGPGAAATLRPGPKPQRRRSAKRIRSSDFVASIAASEPAAHPGRTNMRVVIADSGKRFCAEVCVFLSRYGYQARAVHDPRHLAQTLLEWQPTTLFLNTSLPGLDLQALAPLYARLPRDFRIILLLEPSLPVLPSVPPKTPCLARLLKSPCLTDLRHFL